MSRTNFINQSTVITATWLNGVDSATIAAIGNGANVPNNPTDVKVNLALNNVNNTSDANKPISTATQTALDLKLTTPAVGASGNVMTSDGTLWISAAPGTGIAASAVSYVPTGGISATNVQAAITELDTEKANLSLLASYQTLSEKNQVNGYAGVDGTGKIPVSLIPPVAITTTYVVASQSAMLALSATVGDFCVRTDINQTFVLQTSPPSVLGNWVALVVTSTATQVINTPAGNIAATNVQAALNELDSEKAKVGLATASGLTQNTARMLGRTTASAGAIEEITVGSGLSLSAGTLSASGGATQPIQLLTQSQNFGGL